MSNNYDVKKEFHVQVPMRDGVLLSADIFRPEAAGTFPVILMRTPYDNNSLIAKGIQYAQRGYALVAQDCRGRYDSAGEFYAWHNEVKDGYDTQEWIGRQPWCNGKIGTAGGSYLGLVQWLAAPLRSQYLKTMVPRVITSNFYDSPNYSGGAFQLALNMLWGFRQLGRTNQNIEHYNWPELFRTLPLITADEAAGRKITFWKDWVRHPSYDDYWKEVSIEEKYEQINVPALIMGGWYDLYSKQAFVNYNGMVQRGGTEEARKGTKMIMGAWPHPLSASTITGEVDFGADSKYDLEGMELRWFDYWLKGIDNGIMNEAPIKLFIMGANYWRDEYEWPLARTQYVNYYFHSSGKANSLSGDGALSTTLPEDGPPDRYIYNPDNPVPTLGGNNCCSPDIVAWGAYDQRPAEQRNDVLVYTTPPLAEDIEVTGPIFVKLYASSSAPDTDFTAKLLDVFPDGYTMNLCDGIIRARYQESFEEAKLMKPGTVYEFTIDCWVTGNVFKAGHRIRVELSSSNFPRFDRNPNTGHEFGMDSELSIAEQKVYHNKNYPSHIILPVIPCEHD
ncbi:CocE/NonD family hydrolase [bacterium]|nr:CocE/NonD family hydrolase [bacterium]